MMELRSDRGTDPVDVHVGRRVRARRQTLGVSQVTLAEGIGVTFQQVQKYERGHNRISVSKLYRIAKVLRTPLAYFFEGLADPEAEQECGPIDPSVARSDALLSIKGGAELAAAFVSIETPVRTAIVTLAKACARNTKLGSSPVT